MTGAELIFWFLAAMVFYTYIGYALLVWIILALRKPRTQRLPSLHTDANLPLTALIVPAYNEQDCVEEKIRNSLLLDYPREKLRIIFVTDGSTDQSMELVRKFREVELLHQPVREGKSAAIRRAVSYCRDAGILVFSDANTQLNPEALRLMVRHYQDPVVGGVAGEKKVIAEQDGMIQEKGEELYWKYESFLKKLDSGLYSVVGAAGELFSVRADLFESPPDHIILDDFYISLRVCMKGYVFRYEPRAFAVETASASVREEEKRKIRISAGAFQAMLALRSLLNPVRYGLLSFQYLSRRVFRWIICPIALPLLFLLNAWLIGGKYEPLLLYRVLFIGQCLFYLFASLGWLMQRWGRRKYRLFYVPFYFVFMNLSVWAGFFRFMYDNQSVAWDKSERKIPRQT